MQITIAITVPYHQYREWRREKNKNAGDTVQKTIDGTKQIKIIQEAFHLRRSLTTEVHFQLLKIADDTKQIADDTKQIEDDTKQNCG
ncbi:hypothetical protein T4D_12951 [Trichinella pseudospiralis]|uniref:Uncharacterized protein n=1 Tax=Trichinella pseudospiralis TaxID=6337 RepID=A0A0V1F2P3_TRIPS|nr:hypothetical protein T4D_11492 [Trichinella pseudospiralis]KRY80442.1 hypothetical protein T4D_12951 [Trichinella pseudospiralis]